MKINLLNSFIWVLFNKISVSVINFLLLIVLVRYISPNEFGEISIVLAVIGILNLFFDMGFTTALIQKKRILKIHINSVFIFNLLLGFLLFILLFVFSENIAFFYSNENLTIFLKVLSITVIVKSFYNIHKILLMRNMEFKKLSLINTFSSISGGFIALLLVFFKFGVWSIVIQYLIIEIINLILFLKFSKIKINFEFSFKALKSLFRFGINVFIVSLINAVFGKLDILISAKVISFNLLGYYDRAKQINQIVYSYTGNIISYIFLPYLSKYQNIKNEFFKIYKKIFYFLTFFIFFIIGLLYINSKVIVLLLLGNGWMKTAIYLKLLLLSLFYYIYNSFFTNVILSKGKSKIYLKLEIFKKFVLFFNYIGLYYYGLINFLKFMIITNILLFILDLYISLKELNYKKYFWILLKKFFLVLIFFSIAVYFSEQFYIESNTISFFYKNISYLFIYIVLFFFFERELLLINLSFIFKILKKEKNEK